MFANLWTTAAFLLLAIISSLAQSGAELEMGFQHPPESAKPWVYWFVMDGNLNRQGITADLEAIKKVGLGGVLFMEVDVGIPKGPVKFMSDPWRELFKHANAEAARLGLGITMPASPGWTGSGGPWVKPEQSMQKLVVSETNLSGPQRFEGLLPQPERVAGFYRDVAVLAFPTPPMAYRIRDIQEKALYHRGHFSSEAGVKSIILPPDKLTVLAAGQMIARERIVDLTAKLDAAGRLVWEAPAGQWTVLRFGHTSTGANTRPAPEPGLGLECDKLDRAALSAHFHDFLGKLLTDIGPLTGRSLVSLHIDSWEMGPQNWTGKFRAEFQRRRGYDLLPYLPVMTGRVVNTLEQSERFLWDIRQTVLDLITENHSAYLAELAQDHGMKLSIEPYDGTPCDDMTYGSRADTPMGEFWRDTFNSSFSCTEASSVAHIYGKRFVQAEAFTSGDGERWLAHPATLKTLGDWAFCEGINRFVFHRYAHQPWLDRAPGMTMGPYGIHYERTQTWWEMSSAWLDYLARSQFLLQQGLPVADICYLTPEASPQVFRPPASATRGSPPERLGYSFDGCTPEALLKRMSVKNGHLILPDGMTYRVLVLPELRTMTPALLNKVKALVKAGAIVVGPPPTRSPSLSGYPQCDQEVQRVAAEIWGSAKTGKGSDGVMERWSDANNTARSSSMTRASVRSRSFGKGRVVWEETAAPNLSEETKNPLAPAKWIWHKEGNPVASAPLGKRYFRRTFSLEATGAVVSARMSVTADNAFELWVNEHQVGTGDSFKRLYQFDVGAFLLPGTNLVALAAENRGDAPNPAGLIAMLVIGFQDGHVLEIPTDGLWQSALTVEENWASALDLGPAGIEPWGTIAESASEPKVFCDFSLVSDLLHRMAVPPDFESDGPFRYTHRRTSGAEIYFVANREDYWAGAGCAFRVAGKRPEIWNPLTGQITNPAVWQQKEGRTVLPLWLEPAGSVFVIFRESATSKPGKDDTSVASIRRGGRSLLPEPGPTLSDAPGWELSSDPRGQLTLVAEQSGRYEIHRASGRDTIIEVGAIPDDQPVKGPWEVRFQAGRGAPEAVTLEQLMDLSKHQNAGVRFFSGTAAYQRTLDISTEALRPDHRLYLDLGDVQVMARVTLNGKDLGVLWKRPFRLDITKAARPGANRVEVLVANLWPNRLIGDKSLPPDQRIAQTTWNPFTQDSVLLPSGLLGPVTLHSARQVSVNRN